MTPDARVGSPDKLSLIVFSGDFRRVHYALVLATAAAAIDIPVTMLFTMEACRALLAGNAQAPPGWQSMPAGDGETGRSADAAYEAAGVAAFEELLAAAGELGVRVLVCEMGLRATGVEAGALRRDIPIEETGVVTFLADASKDGAMLFI